ncbi:acyl-CoA dehydrogenase [Stackebrandtia soli]|uniref:acyl-CoA dehydrogenase family protein n=1 Tax=Stackebrandtia soli TaxID=1892856 RepID=UPI0039EAA4D4
MTDTLADALSAFVRGPSNADTRNRLRALFQDPIFRQRPGLTPAQRHQLTYRRLHHLIDAGIVPDKRFFADPTSLCDVMAWAAATDPALFHTMNLHHCLFAGTVAANSDDPDRDLRHARTASGAFLMTEAGRSNSHLAIATIARYDRENGDFVLSTPAPHATKYPTNAGHPDVATTAVVFARLLTDERDHGVFTFIVPLRTETEVHTGVRIKPTVGTSGLDLDYATVAFDDVRVPYDRWLSDGAHIDDDGRLHDPIATPTTRLSRSLAAAPHVWRASIAAATAVTQSAVSQAIQHSRHRVTAAGLAPGQPILGYRTQRLSLMGALADGYALTSIANAVKGDTLTADDLGSSSGQAWAPWSTVDRYLPLLKAVTVDLASTIVDECRERCGAIAFTGTDLFNQYRGLTHAYRSAGGDNLITRLDIARMLVEAALADGHAPDRSDVGDLGANPIGLARECENRLLSILMDRVGRARSAGVDEFGAWNEWLDLAEALAYVHGDRIVMELMGAAVAARPEGRAVLADLSALHQHRWISRRAEVIANCGLMDAALTEWSRTERNRLSDRLADDAAVLIGAFDMRDDILDSPLAADDPLTALLTPRRQWT